METPNNRAGELTEMTMSRIQTQIKARGEKPLETGQYNRIYESVYEVLFRELSRLKAL